MHTSSRSTIEVTTQNGGRYKLATYPGGSYTELEFEMYLFNVKDDHMIRLNLLGGGSATINKIQIVSYEEVPVKRVGGATVGSKVYPGRYEDEPAT